MAADKKAQAVGDILTILIQENNGATRNNNTTTSKKALVNAAIASFLYSPAASGLLSKKGTLPALNYTSDTEFNGGGSINNAETITAQMAVRVVDVLPNGNMVIEGQLRTAFSGEKQDAVVRGTVRRTMSWPITRFIATTSRMPPFNSSPRAPLPMPSARVGGRVSGIS